VDNGDTFPAILNVDQRDVVEGEEIGKGLWGPVLKTRWLDRDVAVKKCIANKSSLTVLLTSREVTRLLRLRHPNVLYLLGFSFKLKEDAQILDSTMIMGLMECDLGKYIDDQLEAGERGALRHIPNCIRYEC